MKLFLDSANLQEIEECLQLGFISGITTNPSLMSKEPKGDFNKHIQKIVDMVYRQPKISSVSIEVFEIEPAKMLLQAVRLFEQFSKGTFRVVIKIPIGWQELRVVSELANRGIPVNVTCCFTEAQCVLAANAGARYVSIFAGRSIDANIDPVATIAHVRSILDFHPKKTEIIVGSVRNAHDITQYHYAGAHIVTASHKLLKQMASHPQTDKSVEGFLNDFKGWIDAEADGPKTDFSTTPIKKDGTVSPYRKDIGY